MKVTKLHIDTRPEEQPQGTYPFGKNGIQFDVQGSVSNEPGFKKLQVVVPYRYIGVIETDSKPVLFSTDNVNSAIGYFDPVTETYEPIVDDATWALEDKLGFSTEWYITGQSQRNYKGEMTIVFTDKRGGEFGWPKYLNCDNPSLSSIDDLRLFPDFQVPDISAEETIGGSLESGAYFVAVGYERNDGTSTAYSAISTVTVVRPGNSGNLTDKALVITIENADTNYDMLRLAIISKIQGVTKAVELQDYIPISGDTITFTYTGDNLTTDISVESILVQPAIYSKVGTMGQLNDYLYIGDLETEPDINDMQPYALTVQIEWKSDLITATAPPAEHVSGKIKGHMHEEVYAFYIRYRKVKGGFTKWFVIAGPTPVPGDLTDSTEATAGGETNPVPRYKVEDTITYFDIAQKTGRCGVWKNDTELYPDTVDFDASSLGGPNLRSQPVLHHKMPSLRWVRKNLYPSETDFGKTKLDLLGIRAVNVRIPDKYQGVLNGYEIGYAKRTVGNMTVYGQSLLLHGVVNDFDKDLPTDSSTIYTSGGNWRTSVWHKGDSSFNNRFELVELREDTFRTHAFDVLFNKPSIEPNFISAQFKLRRENLRTEGYVEDGGNNANLPEAFLIDYTIGNNPVQIGAGKTLRKIRESTYLPNGVNTNGFVNSRHENTFAGKFAGTDWGISYGDSGIRVKGQSFTEAEIGCPSFEETYLINLVAVKSNLYSSFYSQSIVSAGSVQALTSTDYFWGGDTYAVDYTFHTYGRHETNDGWGNGIAGKKAIRRFVCESASNVALRYEIPGNPYSKWYPKEPVALNTENNSTYIITFDRSQDPNQFGYDKSLNSLNDFVSSIIYSPFREELTVFPYRIHRGGRNTRIGRPRSWRTFQPLDFYEMQKNMGRISHLEGMDDRLIIHMENAMFLTQDKTKLESDVLAITLGSGDIFQFEPQEAMSAKLGYAGTRHDLACIRTPIGYVFVDAQLGEMYLYKGSLNSMNATINTFLREYLKVKEKNVFMGNGLTIGWDQKYKRILLTAKNRILSTGTVVKTFQDIPGFWDSLEIGDIVYYQNRYVEYMGINNPEESGYDCPPDPPVDVITWDKIDPFCVQVDGKNTGMRAWANRARRTNGTLDGYVEPNSPNVGQGPYFPPEVNTGLCPLPPDVITWVGTDPECEVYTGPTCSPGYTLSPDGTYCYKEETMPPDIISSGFCIAESNLSPEYSQNGTKLWLTDNYNSTLTDANWILLTSNYWRGNPAGSGETVNGGNPPGGATPDPGSPASPMNREGVWVDTNCDGLKDGLTAGQILQFTTRIDSPTAKTVFVGVGGDNTFKVSLNGVTIVDRDSSFGTSNFSIWYAFPVNLVAGPNFINFQAIGDGSVNDAAAITIMDNTTEEIQAATQDSDLTFLFRTSTYVGETIDIATCPDGWVLDTSGGSGNYVCRRVLTEEPVGGDGANTGMKTFNNRCRLTNGELDGYCEENTETGGLGPYIEPVEDLVACPTEDPDPPGPIAITATVEKFCSDVNCTEQGSVSLKFVFASPTPANLEIWAGQIYRIWNGTKFAVGYELFTPLPPGVTAASFTPSESPYVVNIPAGVTTYTVPAVMFQRDPNPTLGTPFGWTCHNCQKPITDLYFKLSEPDSGYILNVTSVTPDITVHNVT